MVVVVDDVGIDSIGMRMRSKNGFIIFNVERGEGFDLMGWLKVVMVGEYGL